MKNIVLCIFAAAIFAGCATRPANTNEIGIQAGREPSMASIDAAIKAQLASTLKDPDSLKQFQIIRGPDYFTWYRGLVYGGGHDAAWLVCFQYNAKNSYGGYTGVKTEGYALRASNDGAWVVPVVNWAAASLHC